MSDHQAVLKQLKLQSSIDELSLVQPWVESLAGNYQIPEKTAFAIRLCLEELLSNIIRHGYKAQPGHTMTLTFEVLSSQLWSFTTEDAAPHFSLNEAFEKDTEAPLNPGTLKPGGLGIPILKKFTHTLSYEALPVGNRITMTFAAPRD